MLAGALIAVLLQAPGDAGAQLRVAWASQYEWKESGVVAARLPFRYASRWQGKDDRKTEYSGRGEVVVAEDGIVHLHLPGADAGRRSEVRRHLEWVAERFARKPFDEAFKDHVFAGPEKTEDGFLRISFAPKDTPDKKRYYLVKDDRLAGRAWKTGPTFNRQPYTIGNMAGGYAVLGDAVTWPGRDEPTTTTRRLTPVMRGDRPAPERYLHRSRGGFGTSEFTLDFSGPVFNEEHARTGDPAARDALYAAWGRRYTLPDAVRIEADFRRKIDKDLAALGWWGDVKGAVQVWGMDKISVVLDERLFRDNQWAGLARGSCERDFHWFLAWLRDRSPDAEFAGCRFAFAGEDGRTVLVFGYTKALGFRLDDEGRLAGYLRNTPAEDNWWDFKLKKTAGGKARIDGMSCKRGKQSYKLRVKYARRKGIEVPVTFQVANGDRNRFDETRLGVAEYALKKVKVSLPQ